MGKSHFLKKWGLLILLALCLAGLSARAESGAPCGEQTFWSLEGGVLTISGQGPMRDYENIPLKHSYQYSFYADQLVPWYNQRGEITRIVIGEGVTSVGNFAFSECGLLRSVSLPESLSRIGSNAFFKCAKLMDINIPASVQEIGSAAFFGCKQLRQIALPPSVSELRDCVFAFCEQLTAVSVPESVAAIEENAFEACGELTIFCAEGSCAHLYAQEHGISFSFDVPRDLQTAASSAPAVAVGAAFPELRVTQSEIEEELLPGDDGGITERPGFVSGSDLILYIRSPDLRLGMVNTLQYTVLWGEGITEPIQIVDETGAVHGVIDDLSPGVYHGETEIYETQRRLGELRAMSGSLSSEPVRFYVQEEITDAMVERLFAVSDTVTELAKQYPGEDRFSPKALTAIEDALHADARVLGTLQGDGCLFYVTTDHLIGCFKSTEIPLGVDSSADDDDDEDEEGLSNQELLARLQERWSRLNEDNPYGYDAELPASAGDLDFFADGKETFRDWKIDEKDVSTRYLRSEKAMTNAKTLIWIPESTEKTKILGVYYLPRLMDDYKAFLEEKAGFTGAESAAVSLSTGMDALSLLENGAITDYGVMVLSVHGSVVAGPNEFSGNLASGDRKTILDLYLKTYKQYSSFWGTVLGGYVSDLDDVKIFYTHDDKGNYYLSATTSYFAHVLRDKIFDNTIIYQVNCHAMETRDFYELFLRHGAAVVYGAEGSHSTYYGFMVLTEILNNLMTEVMPDRYGSLLSRFDGYEFRVSGDLTSGALDHTMKYWLEAFKDPETEYYTADPEKMMGKNVAMRYTIQKNYASALDETDTEFTPIKYAAREDVMGNYRAAGRSILKGQVIYGTESTPDKPAANVQVTFYRWLNHAFTEKETVYTDENGWYEIELPVGLYGIYATDTDAEEVGFCELGNEKTEAKPIYLQPMVYNNGGDVVGYCSRAYYWKYNDASVAETGMLTGFYINEKARNTLVCRDSKGEETVLAEDVSNGGLYIAHNAIFYKKEGGLEALSLEGKPLASFPKAIAVGVDEVSGNLLYISTMEQAYGEVYQVTDDLNSNRVLEQTNGVTRENFSLKHGVLYYFVRDGGALDLYAHTLETDEERQAARLSVPKDAYLGQVFITGNTLYLSYLTGVGGTGMFFEGASLLSVDLESGKVTRVVPDIASDLYVVAATESSDRQLIYYLGTDGTMLASVHDAAYKPYYTQNVYCLDTADHSVSRAEFLTPEGQFVFSDGNLLARLGPGADYFPVVSHEMLSDWGYTDIQNFSDKRVFSVKRFNIVRRKVYFEIQECLYEKDLSLGWRDGYRRMQTKMWEVDLDTEQMVCINSYGKSDQPERVVLPTATAEPVVTAVITPVPAATLPPVTAGPEAAPAFTSYGAVTVTGGVNVRSRPGTDTDRVTKLQSAGTAVTVIGEGRDKQNTLWYQVRLENGTEGYIRGDLLRVSGADISSTQSELPLPAEEPAAEAVLSFTPGVFARNQKYAVYAAPGANAWRGAKGKAAVSTNDTVWVAGYDQGWLLVMYETSGGSVRVGYIDQNAIKGGLPAAGTLNWNATPAALTASATLTDDVTRQKSEMAKLKKEAQVTFLARYGEWAYVETRVDGKPARGFLPLDKIDY